MPGKKLIKKPTVLFVSALNPASEIETRYKPLWPAYLSAYVKAHLGEETVRFCYADNFIEKTIAEVNPHIVAISSVTQNFGIAIDHALSAKKSNLPVIVGGSHISGCPESMTEAIDIACIGEGEATFLELIQLYIEKGSFPVDDLKNIKGIAFRKDGQIVTNPRRSNIDSIDHIPHPDRSLFGYKNREYIYTARGCKYSCPFCSCGSFWGAVRYASPEYVVEEIEELVANSVNIIRFNDDDFTADKTRVSQIANLIIERGLHTKVSFSCWTRASDIDSEIVDVLKSMNVVAVVMGLESGNDEILKKIKGNASVIGNSRSVDMLKNAGIQVSADFIIGGPDESEKQICDTYRYIKKSRIDLITVNVCSPLPGTKLWQDAEKRGIVSNTMDFSKCSFKFGPPKSGAVHLSGTISHDRLWKLYKKFKRLTLLFYLKAIPKTPWRKELPKLVVKRIYENLLLRKLSHHRRPQNSRREPR